jgi:heme exporter protein C
MTRRATNVLGLVALALVGTTIGMGLALPRTVEQHEYSRLIAIHPPLAWASYVSYGVTALASALYLWPRTRSRFWDLVAGASAEISAVFTALTLVTGSIWGRPTWGVWWVWDARLTLTALMLALLLGYLALRRVPGDTGARGKRSAVVALASALVIPIDHFAVDWWTTLHQDSSIERAKDTLGGPFVAAMLVGFVAFTVLYAWLLVLRFRVEQLEDRYEAEGLDVALAARRAEALPRREPEVVA